VTDIIKAISLWQPWASLWLSPNKLHETRHWKTPHRGRLLVHATKQMVFDVGANLEDILLSEYGGHWGMDLPRGAIIGMVDLIDCIPTERIVTNFRWTVEEQIDNACGNFDDGRFGWRRGTYWKFREPIPYRGRQSIFSVPHEVVAEQIAAAQEVCGG
jgi:activating signal cointegrator 1